MHTHTQQAALLSSQTADKAISDMRGAMNDSYQHALAMYYYHQQYGGRVHQDKMGGKDGEEREEAIEDEEDGHGDEPGASSKGVAGGAYGEKREYGGGGEGGVGGEGDTSHAEHECFPCICVVQSAGDPALATVPKNLGRHVPRAMHWQISRKCL